MNILYITFGDRVDVHTQAIFSICSFLRQKEHIETITVFTDVPSFYNHVKDRVNLVYINPEQLEDWKGPHHFFWRIKIKAIQQFAKEFAGKPVMYLDTDTFLYGSIQVLSTELNQGKAMMHLDEGDIAKGKAKTEKNMWRGLADKNFAGINFTKPFHMWNAGLVASPNTKNGEEFLLALKLCDELCETNMRRRLIEQFALSVSLHQTYGLKSADNYIAHYWGNKEEWNKAIEEFLLTGFLKNLTVEELAEAFRYFNTHAIPIIKKQKNTKARLDRIVSSFFPPKEIRYLE
ncbi:MAG: hypothetical protein JWN76_3697 [Chitinophagaceae bacterium]|nr:hypothetical protein [Chitinophagaceae bacterium]